MQHWRVKIFAETSPGFELRHAIPVFHRWIQQKALPELLLDVADYQHVPAGPGVLLVGQDSHYSLDQTKHRLGLLYLRRTVRNGANASRIRHAWDCAVNACRKLESEPEFLGKIRFPLLACEVSVNDRALAPNTEETFRAVEPDLREVFDSVYGAGVWSLERSTDPRELFSVLVSSATVPR